MATQHEIDGWRNAYKNYSRDQLIAVIRSKADFSAEHIAATQCLAEMVDYAEYERRIIDIARDSNYAFWNALLTFDGIIISVFSAVAVFSQASKVLIFIIIAISMLSAGLLILNFRSVRNTYRLIGKTMDLGVERLSPEQRKQQITTSNRGHEWCNYREMATYYILVGQGILILFLISVR